MTRQNDPRDGRAPLTGVRWGGADSPDPLGVWRFRAPKPADELDWRGSAVPGMAAADTVYWLGLAVVVVVWLVAVWVDALPRKHEG